MKFWNQVELCSKKNWILGHQPSLYFFWIGHRRSYSFKNWFGFENNCYFYSVRFLIPLHSENEVGCRCWYHGHFRNERFPIGTIQGRKCRPFWRLVISLWFYFMHRWLIFHLSIVLSIRNRLMITHFSRLVHEGWLNWKRLRLILIIQVRLSRILHRSHLGRDFPGSDHCCRASLGHFHAGWCQESRPIRWPQRQIHQCWYRWIISCL